MYEQNFTGTQSNYFHGCFNHSCAYWCGRSPTRKGAYGESTVVAACKTTLRDVLLCGYQPWGECLGCVLTRPATDHASAAIAAFLSTAFWVGLVLAGAWPGTSYGFLNDPNFTNLKPPVVFGLPVDPNVALAVLSIILGWVGFVLILRAAEDRDSS